MKCLIFTFCLISVIFFKKDNGVRQDSCQKYYDKSKHSFVYTTADKMPEYPGGLSNFFSFFARGIKYDNVGSDLLQSKVTLVFIVDTSGNIKNAGIYRKPSKDYSKLEKEYLSLLLKMSKWEPGKCNGRKVPVRLIAPFTISYQM